jgi:hypothetical protein
VKVAILGCGPSGLIAAHAAVTAGHDVIILSRRVRSETFGAMYLHEPIPDISASTPDMMIEVSKTGTKWGYAENVYGDREAPVSWDRFEPGSTPGWDLRVAYLSLWRRYSSLIEDTTLTPESVADLKYDRIFNTVPANMICLNWAHLFTSTKIVVFHGPTASTENVMWYNGSEFPGAPTWYRYSRINRYTSWEYSERRAPKQVPTDMLIDGLRVTAGIKPISTDCDCHPHVIRLGRFGKWNKNVFTHHAYMEVRNAL